MNNCNDHAHTGPHMTRQDCPHLTAGCGFPTGECLGACLADNANPPARRIPTHPRLIGLIGPAGCGKDTVRHILVTHHGYAGTAFAEPLRVMVRALFLQLGISHSYIDNRDFKETTIPELGFSYRHLIQTLGTEWAHQCLGQSFWIRCAELLRVQAQLSRYQRVVFSDVRFQTEAAWIREQGGVLWRIRRPQVAPVRDHISETACQAIEADLTLDNSGSLEQLWSHVDNAAMGRSHA